MSRGTRELSRLYHISPSINDERIDAEGLDPSQSKTRALRVYAVEYDLLPWALAHVSARHGVPVSLLSMWSVPFDQSIWKRWRGKVWYSVQVLYGEKLTTPTITELESFV